MNTFDQILNHPRYGKFREWSRGHSLPSEAVQDVVNEYPSQATRAYSGWSAVWERPRVSTWQGHESQLEAAVEDWDNDNERTRLRAEDQAKRDQAKAEEDAERKAEDDARVAAEAAALKEGLRQRFMAMPGTTLEEFEQAYPQLLADHRLRHMPPASPSTLDRYRAF